MNSFIELDGQSIFIKPESIAAIEPCPPVEEVKGIHNFVEYTHTFPESARVLIRLKGREERPYAIACHSFESAKEQARILAEKVNAMLKSPDHKSTVISAMLDKDTMP